MGTSMGTSNKDSEGDFTDEAIKAVEDETNRLAGIVGMDPMELGELFADATFRTGLDTIEEELIIMKTVAIECLNKDFDELVTQFKRKHLSFKLLYFTSILCGFIAILMGGLGIVTHNGSLIALTAVFGLLMILQIFPCMVFTTVQAWILETMKGKNDKAMELADECGELLKVFK